MFDKLKKGDSLFKKVILIVLCLFSFVYSDDAKSICENEEDLRILFIGNSITRHAPLHQRGWYGNWGMAASKIENDYVHQLVALINKNSECNLKFHIVHVSRWESNFNLSKESYQNEKNFFPHIIVVRLGENINEEYAKNNDFTNSLVELVEFFKIDNSKVIITNTFWQKKYIDSQIIKLANKMNWLFVDISDLYNDKTKYTAQSEYNDWGVGIHPNDLAMKEIARRIYNVFDNFEKVR